MSNKILKVLFLFSLVLLITTLNFKLLALNQNFYQKEFSKLDIYEKIPDADKHALNLINYFKDKEELSSFFNEKEKLHLKDVKDLIKKVFLIFYISLILTILLFIYFIYIKDYRILINIIIMGSISTIIITLIFSLILINFEDSFAKFHLISFNNDLWLLNPLEDNLINLFPLQFFYDITKKIIIKIIITSLILSLMLIFKQKAFK